MSEYIKKADMEKILYSTNNAVRIGEEFLELPTYSFPDSAENKGKWIDNGTCTYMCSNCKTEWTTSQIEKMCFCPTCGANMRGKT